jgi:hypothetical protein
MSEGKKNVKPIRQPSDTVSRVGSTSHPRLGGSRMLNALRLAWEVHGFEPSDRLLRAADLVIDHIDRKGRKSIQEVT